MACIDIAQAPLFFGGGGAEWGRAHSSVSSDLCLVLPPLQATRPP